MQIEFKLYASLAQYLPAAAENNRMIIDIPTHSSPSDLLKRFGIPEKEVHLVLRNGLYIPPEKRTLSESLQAGDVIACWPPIAGG